MLLWFAKVHYPAPEDDVDRAIWGALSIPKHWKAGEYDTVQSVYDKLRNDGMRISLTTVRNRLQKLFLNGVYGVRSSQRQIPYVFFRVESI